MNIPCMAPMPKTAYNLSVLTKTMFFDSPKPRVSHDEYKKVRNALLARGFNAEDLSDVDQLFQADLNESSDRERGIDRSELEKGIGWLRKNIGHHRLSQNKIDILEEILRGKM